MYDHCGFFSVRRNYGPEVLKRLAQSDAGTLRQGDRADLVVLNPDKLDDSLDRYAEHPVESYGGLSRMVNRNDDTVSAVLVGGQFAFGAGNAAPALGKRKFGQFLRADHRSASGTPVA